MNDKMLYYSQNGYHRVAAVNHAGEQGRLVEVTQQQAHMIASAIRRREQDTDAPKSTKPELQHDEFGWWGWMADCPDRIEEIIYPDGWRADEPKTLEQMHAEAHPEDKEA